MALITQKLLQDIGISLSEEQAAALDQHFEGELDTRVINEIAEELDDAQLEQLTQLKNGSDEQLMQWLQVNVPDLNEIIEDETAILLGELAENSEHFSE